ncbi:PREDICTED: protein eva-1 isoform X2 [Nicrophorus vespilloides]|uniref:Protein eva-1 isoform X2 n=1 Tax=Nicrophorus vespilloides TaxID=110193 RepID=A0ABM1MVV8_NICVS|nr:PREDICTED: protein eva-1 isoform X2 [Nicrophorus vespilloides]
MGANVLVPLILVLICTIGFAQIVHRVDHFALLSGTLRTYQRAGCDDELVTLKCPPGTSISVQVAQYGKSASTKALCGHRSTPVAKNSHSFNISCLWPNSLQSKWEEVTQGSWGRTVVEACQKKSQCKFQASPKTFGGDPCPGERKYVEVAYKCRPYEFRSKVACENERMQLKCNPNSRVAVYSASYGRTEYESFQCPQPQGVSEETCLVSYATETVMQICHGKRSCEMSADASTFGNPCRPQTRMYLKVVYACVPRKVLKEQYEGQLEPDELDTEYETNEEEDDFDNYDSGNEFIRESAASPPAPNVENGSNNLTKDNPTTAKIPPHSKSKDPDAAIPRKPYISTPRPRKFNPKTLNPFLQKTPKDMQADDINDPNCTVTVYTAPPEEGTKVIGFISEWINAYTFVSQNQERFYLYLILSIGGGVLLCLILVVTRLLIQRHRSKRAAKFHATNVAENTIPNGFSDDISEVDADIDLTTPLPVPTVAIHSPASVGSIGEVVRYPHVHSHTLRRAADNEIPRSLNTGSNSMYYYG